MCGIFGKLTFHKEEKKRLVSALKLLKHRGPDQHGVFSDEKVFMGHQRLSIIDLSEKGKQPMLSKDKDIIITVNGEIYNYQDLKNELKQDFTFSSESDSEVIIYGYKKWGIKSLLKRLDGMFALAIYDQKKGKVFLARDRVGVKPLYFSKINNDYCWSSELKSIQYLYKDGALEIDYTSLYDYLTYRYIPTPKTIYKNIYKLLPAHYMEIDIEKDNKQSLFQYWSPNYKTNYNSKNIDELTKEFNHVLKDSVRSQLISDVPLGLFLSGGLDSASIAHYLPSDLPIKTFTMAFETKRHDESKEAKEIAKNFSLYNETFLFKSKEANSMFKDHIDWFDEPAFNSSNFPFYQLSKNAVEQCKVVLCGDGGDELFGGYKWYKIMEKFDKIRLPQFHFLRSFFQLFFNFPVKKIQFLFKGLDLAVCPDMMEIYSVFLGGMNSKVKSRYRKKWNIPSSYDDYWFFRKYDRPELSLKKRLQTIDFHTFLPEACLTKTDRLSMRNALECRVPFLSNAMIDFAFSLPDEIIYFNNQSKGILKESMKDKLPKKIIKMKKKGFSAPLNLNSFSKNKNEKEHETYLNFYIEQKEKNGQKI